MVEVLGYQEPRILHRPSGAVSSAGREAIELAATAGLYLDKWQETVVEEALSIRSDGLWAASEVGLVVSRQNGKGSIIECIELWGLFLAEEQILHTAHNAKTASEGFRRIERLIKECPPLAAEVAYIRHANGEQGIELRSGARLMFGTRTKGGARGMSLDRVFCDEAMYLSDEQSAAINFTVSARPNPQIWYTGSAGTQESEYFGRVRSRAMKGDDPRLAYFEWSVDPHTDFCTHDCDEHDPDDAIESFAKANPALGIRLAVENCQQELRGMSKKMFRQERLGVGDWPVDGDGWSVISEQSWNARTDPGSQIDGDFVLAVDVTPDRSFSCITAAGANEQGFTHVEITGNREELYYQPGTQWLVPTLKRLWASHQPAAVVIDKVGFAGGLIPELENAGITVYSPNSREYAQGCGEFYSAIVPRKGEDATLVHLGQGPLNSAVAGAAKRDLADMWAWTKRLSAQDISPLVAATLAVWGYKKHLNEAKAADPWVFMD